MSDLEDTVHQVVRDFINQGVLFTALDVSNLVKQSIPEARHRQVRDVVREMFVNAIETVGYESTPITVTLANGDQRGALLYHSLSDAFDLDNKYDAQKRAQIATVPVDMSALPVGNPALSQINTVPSLQAQLDAFNKSSPVVLPVAPMPTARTFWDNLLKIQLSLFPKK